MLFAVLGVWCQTEVERTVIRMQEIVIVDANTQVAVESAEDGIVRVRFGPKPYGVTLVGDMTELHRAIIEADRQIARLSSEARARQ